jgi:hypothetical protein
MERHQRRNKANGEMENRPGPGKDSGHSDVDAASTDFLP